MIFGGLFRAAGVGVNLARSEAKAAVQRAVQKAILGAFAILLVLLALGFGLGAFTVWLAREIGTIQALGFIALGFLILAAILYLIVRLSGASASRERFDPSPIAAALKAEPADGDSESPPGSVLGSLVVVGVVGYLMGRQMFGR